MYVSDFIKQLKDAKDKYGDLQLFVHEEHAIFGANPVITVANLGKPIFFLINPAPADYLTQKDTLEHMTSFIDLY